jgi:hypothetical protein
MKGKKAQTTKYDLKVIKNKFWVSVTRSQFQNCKSLFFIYSLVITKWTTVIIEKKNGNLFLQYYLRKHVGESCSNYHTCKKIYN